MLNELVEFGQRIRNPEDNDALKREFVTTDLLIDAQGNFIGFNAHEKIPTLAEALAAKKGKARLLLDKPEEVLNLDAKKHALYLEKLHAYQDVPSLAPVLLFYGEHKETGLDKAAAAFEESVPSKERVGNIAFLLMPDGVRIHEQPDVVAAIIRTFEENQNRHKAANAKICSLCGKSTYPVLSEPHGMIKSVPDGQSSGSALVSFNANAFESYGLSSNENASICSACARNYVEGLNYLLGNGEWLQTDKGKPYLHYSNRKNLASDTAMIYWTRSGSPTPEIDFADNPAEHEQDIFKLLGEPSPETAEQSPEALELLLQSPGSGKSKTLESVDADSFYSCMLSGAAARIAVRSWIETTTVAMKEHIADWFRDIAVMEYDANAHQPKLRLFALRTLAESCGVHRKKESGGKTAYELDRSDDFLGRAATQLWNCALLGKEPPLLLLDRVLRRIRMEQGKVTAARVALLKLILNRNRYTITGGRSMQARQDPDNATTAYMAGRIFAVLESIQTAALGKEINAPIRDRFFSFASTNPAPAFGRLLKMSQNHLGKLRGDKPGLAVILDKQLGELFTRIKTFPTIFSLEEQGQFAIGYYHQRQESFAKNANNEEQGERHV